MRACFSSILVHSLLQFDPNPWCDADMQYVDMLQSLFVYTYTHPVRSYRYTPMDTTTYQLPDPTWQWVKFIN